MVELNEFFAYVYGEETGYVYLALKNPENQAFLQHYYRWPQEQNDLVQKVLESSEKYEVYYAPALFRTASSSKDDVLGSRFIWVELDGTIPDLSGYPNVPEPSLRIRSSDSSHEHWYWNIADLHDAGQVERVNRALTYYLGADVSGWDAGQILRPPYTTNHKRGLPVEVVSISEVTYTLSDFEALPEPPPPVDIPPVESIPDIQEVIFKYAFPKPVYDLFREGVPEGQRSDGLMRLGHLLAEMGLSAPEMLAVLHNADQRWGKFANRSDQLVRLNEIVVRAKAKHPTGLQQLEIVSSVTDDSSILKLGFLSLLQHEAHVEWVWENWLQRAGYFLLSGPPGVGKTQFALNFAICAALGKPFLEQNMVEPQKMGFFSLEMPLPDLKVFLSLLAKNLSAEEQALLEQNLILYPFGEPLYLTDPAAQKFVMEQVGDEKFDGLVIDSMMACTDKSVSDEQTAKVLMDWNDRLRRRTGVHTTYIHHQRKGQVGNKKPDSLDDIYGNIVLSARTTTAFCLWQDEKHKPLEVIPLKVRLSQTPDPFEIYRTTTLNYTRDKSKGAQIQIVGTNLDGDSSTQQPSFGQQPDF